MIVLGIETSCDETAAAVVRDGHQVLASVIASQVAKHAPYGGVVPELAAREHLQAVDPIVRQAVEQAAITIDAVDAVAVTATPGLLPALLVGVAYAKGLAASLERPLIAVDHLQAHVFGALIDHPEHVRNPATYPLLALIVSGGHTLLVLVADDGACRTIGQTLDDAAGEAFDKAAKILNLGYPGGPVIDQLATSGNAKAIDFPQGLVGRAGTPVRPEDRYNFSFSGVKTSLLQHVRKRFGPDGAATEAQVPEVLDVIASFQNSVVAVLVRKTIAAATEFGAATVVLCGGVACNSHLRRKMQAATDDTGVKLIIAPPKYCVDNAAMIAGLGCYQFDVGLTSPLDIDAHPRARPFSELPFGPAR